MFKKGLVCTIFVLFVGLSFLPCINGDIINYNYKIKISENKTLSSFTDWWPMFRHDIGHSGYSIAPAPNTNIVLWNYTAGSSVHSSPAIVDGKVYFGSMDYKVYCLNAINGTKIWDYTIGHPVSSSPAVYENMVYIGSNDIPGLNGSNLYCLNSSTGEKIWEYLTGDDSYWGVYSSPVVADGKVYIGSGDHKVYCLDAMTGAKLWEFITYGEVCSSPAIDDGKIYIGSQDAFVYCLNASTGAELWTYVTGHQIQSSPTVVNGKIYIGSDRMYCLNAETGANIWNRLPSFLFSSPAVYNDKVYICDADNTMYCFNADNGMIIWQYTTGQGDAEMWSSPAVADGKVYVGSRDGKLYCFDADTGEKIWDYLTGYYPIFSSPAIANGRIYIGDMIGDMLCFGQANNPPNKPNIYGPDNGTTNVEYTFCTDTITDPEGDSLYCFWDWGDGNNSGWLGPYASGQTICASHRWAQPGIYCIMLKLKDDYGMESEWSDPLCITIVENQPPSAPSIDGPTHVKVRVENTWSFISIDPEQDNITYYVDWGDKCGGAEYYGPYPSGQKTNLSHKYLKKNVLIINALAIDSHGAESQLTFFEVEISINRAFENNKLFQQLFRRFPLIISILKHLI